MHQYLELKPAGLISLIHLYAAYAKAILSFVFNGNGFLTVGQYLSKPVIVTQGGIKFYARSHSEDIGYYAHLTKPYTFRWFKPSNDETVVDCGSSVGFFTLLALSRGSSVYAFEPRRDTYEILKKNIEMNKFSGKAEIFNMGLSDSEGELILNAPDNFTGTSSFDREWVRNIERRVSVKEQRATVSTLDKQLADVGKVNWLLIDVEGFELNLLRGQHQYCQELKG